MKITVAEYRKRNHFSYVATNPGRILEIQKRKKEFENSKFDEKDLRGLSKYEKQFLIENNLSRVYNQFYLFIEKNLATGKKQLYAFHKIQSLFPNGHDLDNHWNSSNWLIFDRRFYTCSNYEAFSTFRYEYRFSQIPHNFKFVFAE